MRFIIAIITATLLFACNSKPVKPKITASDTVRTLGCFVDFPKKEIRWDMIYQITQDRVIVDSFLKSKLVRDTSYYVNVTSDTTDQFLLTLKESVSTHFNLDTSINRLMRWIKANENLFPKDSLNKKK